MDILAPTSPTDRKRRNVIRCCHPYFIVRPSDLFHTSLTTFRSEELFSIVIIPHLEADDYGIIFKYITRDKKLTSNHILTSNKYRFRHELKNLSRDTWIVSRIRIFPIRTLNTELPCTGTAESDLVIRWAIYGKGSHLGSLQKSLIQKHYIFHAQNQPFRKWNFPHVIFMIFNSYECGRWSRKLYW